MHFFVSAFICLIVYVGPFLHFSLRTCSLFLQFVFMNMVLSRTVGRNSNVAVVEPEPLLYFVVLIFTPTLPYRWPAVWRVHPVHDIVPRLRDFPSPYKFSFLDQVFSDEPVTAVLLYLSTFFMNNNFLISQTVVNVKLQAASRSLNFSPQTYL